MFANRLRLVAAGAALVMSASLTVASSAAAEPAAAGAKEERTITIKGIEPRSNVFIAKGKVSPAYENKRATVQRKVRGTKTWKGWKAIKTSNRSRYRERISPLKRKGVVCYRIKVKGNKTYKTSYSGKVCIKTF